MDKWEYIRLINSHPKNNRYGCLLIELMEINNKTNLRSVTLKECEDFYKSLQNRFR